MAKAEAAAARAGAAGWSVKAGGAGGIWSMELAARRGQELRHRGCATELERVPEVSG